MSRIRRSLTVAAVSSMLLSGLAVTASAEGTPTAPGTDAAPASEGEPPGISRGLIVQTTTSTVSDGTLDATDQALGSDADVVGGASITGKVSSIGFDEPVSEETAADVALQIEKRPDVLWATPDTLRRHDSSSPTPRNDPYFTQQRNLWNTSMSAGGFSVKAPRIWPSTEGAGVRVAVLDTGIRPDHPELAGQLVAGYDMVSADQKSGRRTYLNSGDGNGRDGSPSDPGDWATKGMCFKNSPAWDSSWHGTFVAGQIAARSNNGKGIAGLAPQVKIQPVRVLGRCGGWDSDIVAGMTWAAGGTVKGVPANTTPARVVNMSLGAEARSRSEQKRACAPYESVVRAGRASGVVFVASAGNSGGNADLAVPASCDGVVSVAATSLRGFRASYSNHGSTVDLAAPGGDTLLDPKDSILSLGNTGRRSPKTSSYTRYEGTSMAAPQVSAAAAMLVSLGMDSALEVERGLRGATTKFRNNNSAYAHKAVRYRGRTYVFNLNCHGRYTCGTGILDLGQVNHPLAPPVLSDSLDDGHGVVGEVVSVRDSWAKNRLHLAHRWYREPVTPDEERVKVSTSSYYEPVLDDVGHRLTVETSGEGAWAAFSTSASTKAVRDAPVVSVYGPETHVQGTSFDAHVHVGKSWYSPWPVADGPVEVTYGDVVVGTVTTVNGSATIEVPASAWRLGPVALRARYLGAGETAPATSARQTVTGWYVKPSVSGAVVAEQDETNGGVVTATVVAPPDERPTGGLRVHLRLEGGDLQWVAYAGLEESDGGTRTINLPHVQPGEYQLVVTYEGYLRETASSDAMPFTAR